MSTEVNPETETDTADATPELEEICLHRVSRVLEVSFADGTRFELPCEYLRVFSPSAEVRGHSVGEPVLVPGKSEVSVEHIEAVGNYAIQLHFDDGHNTGIYSWAELYRLGRDHDSNWTRYLQRLEEAGEHR